MRHVCEVAEFAQDTLPSGVVSLDKLQPLIDRANRGDAQAISILQGQRKYAPKIDNSVFPGNRLIDSLKHVDWENVAVKTGSLLVGAGIAVATKGLGTPISLAIGGGTTGGINFGYDGYKDGKRGWDLVGEVVYGGFEGAIQGYSIGNLWGAISSNRQNTNVILDKDYIPNRPRKDVTPSQQQKSISNTNLPRLETPTNREIVTTNLGNKIDITPSRNHRQVINRASNIGESNSSVDILNHEGKIKTRRFYGNDGKAYRDVDMTTHGNSGTHSEYPHEHFWKYDTNGNVIGR